jgi:hypothetical protein
MFLEPRLVHSGATVVIPLNDRVVFVGAFHGAHLVGWLSKIAQRFDAITGIQVRVGALRLSERRPFGAI